MSSFESCEYAKSSTRQGISQKFAEKTISNNYEVCTAVALCFPYSMVLENINLYSDVHVHGFSSVNFCKKITCFAFYLVL
jgi:hypothetical protein